MIGLFGGSAIGGSPSAVPRSVFLDHYFGGLDDSSDRVALLEFQLIGAAPGDGALDEIVSHPDDYMGHDIAELSFFDFSTQLVSR